MEQPFHLSMKKIHSGHITGVNLLVACLLFTCSVAAQPCTDAASIISLSNPDQFFIKDQFTTRSGHRVYCGWIGKGSDTSALLLYQNEQGEIQWARSYKTNLLSRSFFLKAIELRDGNIIVTGKIMDSNGMLEYLLIAKFDAAGNFLWHRLYKPGAIVYDQGRIVPLQIVEDDLGTLYFSFCDQESNFSAIARIDANGNMLWSRSFRYGHPSLSHLAIAFMPVSVNNDTLYLVGTGLRDQYAMKLNRNTGELQSVNRFSLGSFRPAASFVSNYANGAISLPNGHSISIARVLYGLPHQYFFIEWDEKLRFVKAFSLDIPDIIPQGVAYSFTVLPNGTIIVATPYPGISANLIFNRIYIAAFNTSQQQLLMQKKVLLRRNDYRYTVQDESFAGTDQNGRLVLTPGFPEPGQTAIDMYKFNLDGVQQDCIMHEDTSFAGISQQSMQETAFTFDEVAADVLEEVSAIATVSNENFFKQAVCERISACEDLSIKGPAQICAGNVPAILTVSKSENCTRKVKWQLDNTVADSVKTINDSTIHLFFSKEWQGPIRASLEGCGLADTFDLTVKKAIPAQLAAENITQLCIEQNDTLSPGNDFLSYTWQDGTRKEKMIVESPGTYWVKVTDKHGCESADTVTVTDLYDRPRNFIITDTSICLYNNIKLQPKGDFIAWRWSTGDTTSSIKVMKQGVYTIAVTDRNNCTGSEQVVVNAKSCNNYVFFPSAFSPNGDRKNDSFRPVITGNLLNYRMMIYTRWGQKIFESVNPDKGWNGRIGSVLQATGTYVWQAVVEFAGEAPRMLRGTIVLLR